MKAIIAILAGVFFCSLPLLADSTQQSKLVITPQSWDFGTIDDTQIVDKTFTIKNLSHEKVDLVSLPTLCGCVVYSPEPSEIPPQGESQVFVQFNPKDKRGAQSWEIKIQTNLPSYEEIVIPMQAHVLRKDILSEWKVNMGIFKKNQPQQADLWLVCPEQPDFKLLSVTTTLSGIDITTKERQVEGFHPGAQRGYQITFRANSQIPYGKHHEEITLKTTIKGKQKIVVPLWAYVQGEIAIAPDYVSFGLMKKGESKRKRVTIYREQLKEFQITQVEVKSDFLQVELKPQIPGKYYYLWITASYPEKLPEGEFRDTIFLHTDYDKQKVAPIHIQGFKK